MTARRLIGLTLLAGGILLLVFAYQGSQSLRDQAGDLLTGSYSSRTNWLLVIGGVACVLGLLGVLLPGRRGRRG